MNNPFTISAPVVSNPGWTVASVTPPSLIGGQYVGEIDYAGGTPVPADDVSTLTYGYTISFGAGNFSFTQTVTPVPEPGALALLAGISLGLLALRRRLGR
jgi:hypothetical protein